MTADEKAIFLLEKRKVEALEKLAKLKTRELRALKIQTLHTYGIHAEMERMRGGTLDLSEHEHQKYIEKIMQI